MKIQKLTPIHTLDWYVKWVASFLLIIGAVLTSNNVYPVNLVFHSIGIFGWLFVGIIWNDRALIIINAVTLALMSNGLISYYVT